MGDWSGCDGDVESLNPEDNSWEGLLTSGTVSDDFGDCTPPEFSTVSLNLDIHMPCASYKSLARDLNIWIDLEFLGTDSEGKLIWGLKQYGEID